MRRSLTGVVSLLLLLTCAAPARAETWVNDDGGGSYTGRTAVGECLSDGGSRSERSTSRTGSSAGMVDPLEAELWWDTCSLAGDTKPSWCSGAADGAEVSEPFYAEVAASAREVIARLQLPHPRVLVGPDPGLNPWGMAVVGYPLWLWSDEPDAVATYSSADGLTFSLRAHRTGIRFSMGDGAVVRCTSSTPYPASIAAGTPSPTCGYTYQRASLPEGAYTVVATASWVIDWSSAGFSGSLTGSVSDSRQLPVGELFALVTR